MLTLRRLPRASRTPYLRGRARCLHSSPRVCNEKFNPAEVERAEDEVDVCIVGGGPAGLSAAIRLKQLEREKGNGRELRVVVLEKGSEAGSHILSGAVIEPRALDELIPEWRNGDHPLTQPATRSRMLFLTEGFSIPLPHPPQMNVRGNYPGHKDSFITSLSGFTRWLAGVAEEHGVEVYPGFAGAQLAYGGEDVVGVVTNEVGLARDYTMKSSFEPGMRFRARATLLAEGAHGSLTKEACRKYRLRDKPAEGSTDPVVNPDPQAQTYGFGLKEVWQVPPEVHRPGEVVHTLGWPLSYDTYGGGWVYHMADNLVSVGLVVGLNYKNPYMQPYREFQRMKHHPYMRALFDVPGAQRLAYGARTMTSGGLQSLPARLHFPGGALIGCAAGMVNVGKIKGTHNAMKSGMIAAEAAFDAIMEQGEEAPVAPVDMSGYTKAFRDSWVYDDLYEVRNLKPSFGTSLGIFAGAAYSGVDSLLHGKVPWTLRHSKSSLDESTKYDRSYDSTKTESASRHKPIDYPPFQPPLSTDLMTSVALTGTDHEEDEPVHLKVGLKSLREASAEKEKALTQDCNSTADARREHVRVNVEQYAGLLQRACPAGVYEYVDVEKGQESPEAYNGKKLVINSQNCIHCKLCDIKVPTQDVTWSVPQGGGGPKYTLT
ncbi:hypothetical protein EV715DRAFT_253812 [Schizophyllum commune]